MAVMTDALHGALLEEAASLTTKAGRQTEAHQKLSLLMDFVSDVMVLHPASILLSLTFRTVRAYSTPNVLLVTDDSGKRQRQRPMTAIRR